MSGILFFIFASCEPLRMDASDIILKIVSLKFKLSTLPLSTSFGYGRTVPNKDIALRGFHRS